MTIKKLHRYLSLTFLLFWLMQALTGVLISFRWELDDFFLGGQATHFDLDAFSDRLMDVQNDPRYQVRSVWTSGGHADRYDFFLIKAAGGSAVMRIDGSGKLLRVRNDDQWFSAGGIYDSATTLHANLFAGDLGHWLISFSGLLLLSNLILGLKLAWPRKGQWRRSLTTKPVGALPTRLYGWHRLLGLWFAIPALFVVLCGSMLALSDPFTAAMNWNSPLPDLTDKTQLQSHWDKGPVSPAHAIRAALVLHPQAQFSGMYPPNAEDPFYTIRLLTPTEPGQKFGKTAVLVSPVSGKVLVDQAANAYPIPRRLVNSLFPLHTGQIAATPGRLVNLLVGVFLLTMMGLGFALWWKRRARR